MVKTTIGNVQFWTAPVEYDAETAPTQHGGGTVDLSPGIYKMAPHSSSDMLTKLCATPVDWDASSALLDAFLDRFLPDLEERHFILTTLAVASLIGGNSQRAFLMMLGPTTTGKTTLIKLITDTLGGDYVSTVPPSIFRGNLEDKPRPDIIKALSARLVVANEGSDSWELHADQVKRITGEDVIPARGMSSNIIRERVALFTPIIVSNTTPKIKAADDAVRMRLRVMVMDSQHPEDDGGESRQALLGSRRGAQGDAGNAAAGCSSRRTGRCPPVMPPRFVQATNEVFAELDDVDGILKELISDNAIQTDISAPISRCMKVSELYTFYTDRAKSHGTERRDVLSQKAFMSRIKSLGIVPQRSDGMRIPGFCLVEHRPMWDGYGV